jgi:hypothetical protein
MIKNPGPAFLISLAFLAAPVHAFHVPEIPLAEKFDQSTLVAVGRVSSTSTAPCPVYFRCAKVELVRTIKGQSAASIEVLYGGEMIEKRPWCCEPGKTYFFFLKKKDQNIYESINSPYGIVEISIHSRLSESASALAREIGEDFVKRQFPDFEKRNTRPVLSDLGKTWRFTYVLREGTLGGAPVVIIDKSDMSILDSHRTQ